MNLIHRCLCRSASWRTVLEKFVVPWALADVQLGDDVLELGPGHGITTDLLRSRISRITALEIEHFGKSPRRTIARQQRDRR